MTEIRHSPAGDELTLGRKQARIESEQEFLRYKILSELKLRDWMSLQDLRGLFDPVWDESEVAVALGILKERGLVTSSTYPQGVVWRLKK